MWPARFKAKGNKLILVEYPCLPCPCITVMQVNCRFRHVLCKAQVFLVQENIAWTCLDQQLGWYTCNTCTVESIRIPFNPSSPAKSKACLEENAWFWVVTSGLPVGPSFKMIHFGPHNKKRKQAKILTCKFTTSKWFLAVTGNYLFFLFYSIFWSFWTFWGMGSPEVMTSHGAVHGVEALLRHWWRKRYSPRGPGARPPRFGDGFQTFQTSKKSRKSSNSHRLRHRLRHRCHVI